MATSPYVKALQRETGKDLKEIQKHWEKAKESTSEAFGIKEDEFDKKQFDYAKQMVLESLGVDEKYSVSEFIKSDKSARDFIDEAVQVSSDFDGQLDTPMINKEEPYEDEEEGVTYDKNATTGPEVEDESKEYEFNKGESGVKETDMEEEKIFSGKIAPEEDAPVVEEEPEPESEEGLPEELKEEMEDSNPHKS